ncbi:hypothetical protein BHE74_00016633 [Ensete ventricosum]|nr:hypothetical protein BHE74_00016633 [Ensete ventricosum]
MARDIEVLRSKLQSMPAKVIVDYKESPSFKSGVALLDMVGSHLAIIEFCNSFSICQGPDVCLGFASFKKVEVFA